jgi:hypothetical protein
MKYVRPLVTFIDSAYRRAVTDTLAHLSAVGGPSCKSPGGRAPPSGSGCRPRRDCYVRVSGERWRARLRSLTRRCERSLIAGVQASRSSPIAAMMGARSPAWL